MSDTEKTPAELHEEIAALRARLHTLESADGTMRAFTDIALDAQLDTFFLFEPATGRTLRWNRAFAETTGYTDAEIAELPAPAAFYGPEDLERAGAFVEEVFEHGTGTIELDLICKDGRRVPTEYRVSVVEDGAGDPRFLISIGRDISKRKRTLAALHKSDEIINTSRDAVITTNLQRRITFWNRGAEQSLGYTADEALDQPIDMLYKPEDIPVLDTAAEKVLSGHQVADMEVTHISKSGEEVRLLIALSALRDADGHVTELVGIAKNITDRIRLEKRLALITQAIDNSLNGFDIIDEDGKFIYVNKAYVDMWGYDSAAEILGTSPVDHCADPEMPARVIADLKRQGYFVGEFEGRRKNGELFDVRMYALLDHDDQGREIYTGTSIDISERKRALESLRESERRLTTLMSNLPGMAYRCLNDQQWTMEFMSDGVERITGYPAVDLVENRTMSYNALIHPDDRQRVWKTVQDAVATQGSFRLEYRILNKAGAELWVLEQGGVAGVRDDGVHVLEGYITDITELRDLEKQLLQSQKMEAVGRLAGGVAHDFNNILMVINNYSDIILSDLVDDDPLRRDMSAIRQASERATELTRQLLAFSRKQIIQPQVIDVSEAVARSESVLRRLISESIEFVTVSSRHPLGVWADPGQFDQILFNLVVNARDAMPDGGRLTICTGATILDEASCRRLGLEMTGRYATLTISDTGHGMDAETRRNVFEPFFTTKQVGKGTGLGLSTVYGIVKQHDGAIEVESDPGEGASFRIYLPLTEESTQDVRPARESDLPRGDETILLVEDDPSVRRIAERILTSLGYTVVSVPGPLQAIEHCAGSEDPIHLVLTDVVMPDMSGKACSDRIRELRPELGVLFMSGHSEDTIAHHGVLDPNTPFLQKPFDAADLARKVRELLDG